jgi:hypothetical protein
LDEGAIVAIGVVVDRRRRVLVVLGDFGGHGGRCWFGWLRVFGEFGSPNCLRSELLCGDFLFGGRRLGRLGVDGSARTGECRSLSEKRLGPKYSGWMKEEKQARLE